MERRRVLDDLFGEFEEMERIFEELFRERINLVSNRVGGPLYYGFSIYVGPDGKPAIREIGNIEPLLEMQSAESKIKEPFADITVDEKNGGLIATIELPGIEKEEIEINARESSIEITAGSEDRKYRKNLPLQNEIEPKSAKATYNNGVLEVKAKLKESPKRKGFKIEVK
ncbi:MAG: archaeal heat shock protein Hsp20 [Candidatus Hydrothermarchaeales archaeon]